jgi:hypothetical protein
MESELSGESDSNVRKKLNERLLKYSKEWKANELNYKKVKQEKDREALFGTEQVVVIDVGHDEGKQKLAQNTNNLRGQQDTINKMLKLGIEVISSFLTFKKDQRRSKLHHGDSRRTNEPNSRSN